jgi:serine/threonine protein kinase
MEAKTYLNRFRIITGQTGLPIRVVGGAGERTYKAEDITSGQAVALELVPAGGLHPELLRQLEAEATSAKRLNHINIPKLYDFGFENDHLVYASELFDGTTAEAWVTTHGPLAVGATLRIAQQVVGALGAATFHGILHHAINPKNIIIVPGQTTDGAWPLIKVLNFVGVAPEVTAADAGALSNAHFASPEQLENGNVDFRSELYSLGKTLSFLLTGSALGHGAQNVERARGIPASVKELIGEMVANDPADRPLDPLAFQQRIQDLIAQVDRRDQVATKFGVAPAQPAVVDRTARPLPTFFKPLAWAALLLTIATIAGLGIAASLRSNGDVAKNEKQIGVPVGVPEATAAPVTAAAVPSLAPTAAPATDAVNANDTAGAVAANPPVLTSDPDPTAPVDTAVPSPEPASPQSTQVASSNNAPAATSRTEPATDRPADRRGATEQPRVVASNTQASSPAEEPIPPGAGPDARSAQGLPAEISETANSYAVARPSNNSNSNTSEPTEAADSDRSSTRTTAPKTVRQKPELTTVASAATPRPKKSSPAAASAPKREKRGDDQIADARRAMPPVPRGAVRAEYLGTTPDGNLVFGLPSSERGYVAPGESRRRSRRAQPPSDVDVLPAEPAVLPALPADDE